jgi:hypothetical protein
MTQTEEQAKMDREGRSLGKEHAAQLAKDLAPLDKQNEALLKAGRDNPRILGAGADGLGTKGMNQAAHKLAHISIIGRKG